MFWKFDFLKISKFWSKFSKNFGAGFCSLDFLERNIECEFSHFGKSVSKFEKCVQNRQFHSNLGKFFRRKIEIFTKNNI